LEEVGRKRKKREKNERNKERKKTEEEGEKSEKMRKKKEKVKRKRGDDAMLDPRMGLAARLMREVKRMVGWLTGMDG